MARSRPLRGMRRRSVSTRFLGCPNPLSENRRPRTTHHAGDCLSRARRRCAAGAGNSLIPGLLHPLPDGLLLVYVTWNLRRRTCRCPPGSQWRAQQGNQQQSRESVAWSACLDAGHDKRSGGHDELQRASSTNPGRAKSPSRRDGGNTSAGHASLDRLWDPGRIRWRSTARTRPGALRRADGWTSSFFRPMKESMKSLR